MRDVLARPGAEKLTGDHVHEVIQRRMGIKFDQTHKKNMYVFFQKCLWQSLAKKKFLTKKGLPKCARPAWKRARRAMRHLVFNPSAGHAIARRERAMMWEEDTCPLKTLGKVSGFSSSL